MIKHIPPLLLVICLFSTAASSQPGPPPDPREYAFPVKNIYIGKEGHIHIVQINGTQIELAPERGQVSVSTPLIASDKMTVGWLVELPCCESPKGTPPVPMSPFPRRLLIYRQGKIINSFAVGPLETITEWHFLANGKEVSLCTDVIPMNSIALSCELVEIDSRLKDDVIEHWDSRSGKPMPTWAKEEKQ